MDPTIKIVVPEGMMKAVEDRYGMIYSSGFNPTVVRADLEAALRWLSENPIVPSVEQWHHLRLQCNLPEDMLAVEWQRRMFLAPGSPDNREMTTYDCLDCKKSWKQQLREPVALCVYCQSSNTKPICTTSAVRDFSPAQPEPEASDSLKWPDENEICEIGAILRDKGVRISNDDVGSVLKHFVASRNGAVVVEPKIPEEVKDLFWEDDEYSDKDAKINSRIVEAYRRGQKSKETQ